MAIGRAIKKHGWEAFDAKVVQQCSTMGELNEAERFWIDRYDSLAPHGYNIREGGLNGRLSAETREKMRGPRGKYRVTAEGRDRIRLATAAALRLPRSAESNAKRSAALKGKSKSDETRKRMAVAAHNRLLSDEEVWEVKKFRYYGLSLPEIGRAFGLSKSGVSGITSGRNGKHVVFLPDVISCSEEVSQE